MRQQINNENTYGVSTKVILFISTVYHWLSSQTDRVGSNKVENVIDTVKETDNEHVGYFFLLMISAAGPKLTPPSQLFWW